MPSGQSQVDMRPGIGMRHIVLEPGGDEVAAHHLAQQTGIPVVGEEPEGRGAGGNSSHDLIIRFGTNGISLAGNGMVMRPDLTAMVSRLQPGRLNRELLVRAAKFKHGTDNRRPIAVDATAGLGEDALLLAAAGFDVLLFEQDPVIAALLDDSLRRAAQDPRIAEAVSRMHRIGGDSIAALPQLEPAPDVVYLDPMFPARRKSAAVKKKFQLIHELERPCENQGELLAAALAARPRKVIVKRPAKGEYLAGRKPSYTIAGKSVRYDCLVP